MNQPKLISPLLDNFAMGDAISSHNGVSCYPAMREGSDDKYIVKVISIPSSPVQLDALLLTGAYQTKSQALAYFEELAQNAAKEADVLKQLAQIDSFVSYEDWQIIPMEDGNGYQIYLLGSYKYALDKYVRHNPMTHLKAVNLGLDLCAALAACRRAGYLYVDLKPENIYVSPENTYHIGDLGFISLDSLQYASLPERYRSKYTAPEITDAFATLNDTIDIYALGLILYQAYNNGELPFDEVAPEEDLPAPVYADYEMSEIILRACAPKPEDRWADPAQMSQALVGYMQRNGANDTPIIPLAVAVPQPEEEPSPDTVQDEETDALLADEAFAEDATQEESAENAEPAASDDSGENLSEEDAELDAFIAGILDETQDSDDAALSENIPEDAGDLSFIDHMVSDETAPSDETATELQDASLTSEASDILAQADDLLAHETPAPVIAPEPIEITVPSPIQPQAETAVSTMEPDEPAAEEASEPDEADNPHMPRPRRRKKRLAWLRSLLVTVIILALLAGLGYCGYYYYENIYLQSIDSITLDGSEDQLTVQLDTDIPYELLTVTCTDTYGISKVQFVTDGMAHFSELPASTQYTITVSIDGFHKLTGATTASYATKPSTNVVTFTAITGSADGSVILHFTVDGPTPDVWTIAYGTGDGDEQTVTTSEHSVQIGDLTLGEEYTFRLVATDDLYLVGNDTVTYTATPVVYAENLRFESFDNGMLHLNWDVPENAGDQKWTVTQYNEAGEIVWTANQLDPTEEQILIPISDTTVKHTFDVQAESMTQSTKIQLSANPIQINDMQMDSSNPPRLYLSWSFDGPEPANGWYLTIAAEDYPYQEVVSCSSNSYVMNAFVPGTSYVFTLQAADETTLFNQVFTFDAPEAQPFSGYWVTNENLDFTLCKTPDVADWDRTDLKEEDYTNTFSAGDKASVIAHLNRTYGVSQDMITISFVFRNADGVPVHIPTMQSTWTGMWYRNYGELDIPSLPSETGTYTMDIYFNGMFAGTQTLTIK